MFSLREDPDTRSLFGSTEALSLTHQPKGFALRPFFKMISKAVTLYIKTFHLSLSLGSGSALSCRSGFHICLRSRPAHRSLGPLTLVHLCPGSLCRALTPAHRPYKITLESCFRGNWHPHRFRFSL